MYIHVLQFKSMIRASVLLQQVDFVMIKICVVPLHEYIAQLC